MIFINHTPTRKGAVLIVYVNDIILIGDHDEEILKLKNVLARESEIKDLGNFKYFLGMEVARSKGEISIL